MISQQLRLSLLGPQSSYHLVDGKSYTEHNERRAIIAKRFLNFNPPMPPPTYVVTDYCPIWSRDGGEDALIFPCHEWWKEKEKENVVTWKCVRADNCFLKVWCNCVCWDRLHLFTWNNYFGYNFLLTWNPFKVIDSEQLFASQLFSGCVRSWNDRWSTSNQHKLFKMIDDRFANDRRSTRPETLTIDDRIGRSIEWSTSDDRWS